MTLLIEHGKSISRPKFLSGVVLTLLLLGFSTGTAFAQLCYEPPSMKMAPTETKMIGDVMLEYFASPGENVQLTYENAIFKRKTKAACHNLKLRIRFFNYGGKPKIPESVGLTFWSVSNRVKYETAASRQFKILAGEAEIYSSELYRELDEYKKNQSYSEILGAEFSFSTLEKMAKAKNITFVLGGSNIKLTAKDLQAVKQLTNLANAKE